MKINKIKFENYSDCYEIIINNNKMIITTEFGPRILFFGKKDGKNILYHDIEKKNRIDDFILYGGHRLWIGPETKDTYNPDNDKCKVEKGDDFIKVTGFDKKIHFEKSFLIKEKNGNFSVTDEVVNKGKFLAQGSIWALTCVVPEGTVFFPWNTIGSWKMNKIIFWKEWLGQKSNINSQQYRYNDDLFFIEPTGETGKIGTSGYGAFIGVTNHDYTFIKKFDRLHYDNYPDDNCAIECYTCKDFIELETLSPNGVFMPDVKVSHNEEWIVADGIIDYLDLNNIKKLL